MVFIMILAIIDMYRYQLEKEKTMTDFMRKQTEWNRSIETKIKYTREFIRSAVDDIYVDMDLLHTGITTSLAKIDIHNENERETIESIFMEMENIRSNIQKCGDVGVGFEDSLDGVSIDKNTRNESTQNNVLIGFQNGGTNPCIPIFIPKNIEKFDREIMEKYKLFARNKGGSCVYLLLNQFAELVNIKKIHYSDLCHCILVNDIYSTNNNTDLASNIILDNYSIYVDEKSNNYFKKIKPDNALFDTNKIIKVQQRMRTYGIELVLDNELDCYIMWDVPVWDDNVNL